MAANKSNKSLQMMMAAASLVGFLGGWALLGHAPKPGAVVQSAPSVASTSGVSLRPSQIQTSGGLIQLQAQSSSRGLRLRTGGS